MCVALSLQVTKKCVCGIVTAGINKVCVCGIVTVGSDKVSVYVALPLQVKMVSMSVI